MGILEGIKELWKQVFEVGIIEDGSSVDLSYHSSNQRDLTVTLYA